MLIVKAKKPIMFIIPALLFFTFLFFWPQLQIFCISDPKGNCVFVLPVKPGDSFQYIWTHSVEMKQVTEINEITKDNSLLVKRIIFNGPAAGLSDAYDKNISIYNDHIQISSLNRKLKKINVRVATVKSQILIIHDKRILLQSLAKPQDLLTIKVKRCSVFQYLVKAAQKGCLV